MHLCAHCSFLFLMSPLSKALQKSTVFDALVGHIQNALDTPSLQAAALQLLRRVLLRNQVLTAAVYQCIEPWPSKKRGSGGRGKTSGNSRIFKKLLYVL